MNINCGRCGTTWTGMSACHCSGCHRTWAGIKLFDRHRHNRGERGGCLRPDEITMPSGPLVLIDGIWRETPMTDEQKLARFGARKTA